MTEISELQKEYSQWYAQRYLRLWENDISPLWDIMDKKAAEHPDWTPLERKTMQYEVIAENFTPVLFRNSPFFFETGLRFAEHRGTPDWGLPGSWMTCRNDQLVEDSAPDECRQYQACGAAGIHLWFNFWDSHHHSTNSTNIIQHGLKYFADLAQTELAQCRTEEERIFLQCAIRGIKAMKRIAERFAEEALRRLMNAEDEQERKFLSMIESAARNVPWKPAATFYEGLAVIQFLYEVVGSLEGNGLSACGRPDYVLGPLYEQDLREGRITPEEAGDLIARFLCFTDCRYDKYGNWDQSYNSQENGTALSFGGYDESGNTVCNDVTMMFLRVHRELNLLFPKIQARITRNTPQCFLSELNRNWLSGRNVIALQNDEAVIPAQIAAGKTFADASHYTIGACWEIIVEGYEHSAGANCYFNLLKILDMSIHDDPDTEQKTGAVCTKLDSCRTFDELYEIYLQNVLREIRRMCESIRKLGSLWPQVNPSPAYSASMFDCIRKHRDYTAGGGRYNPHALPLGGFANTIDSLLVIKDLCFDRKICSFAELLDAVRRDWNGADELRHHALSCRLFFGDNQPESMTLARRLYHDIYNRTRDLKNERGGSFQLAFYMAWEYLSWADKVKATPDGRRRGDVIANGITPSRTHRGMALTSVLSSVGGLDLTMAPANASLDVSLPLGGLNDEILSALERSFVAAKCMQMQLNCVSADELRLARKEPEKHWDLFVRIFGFSARFVLLPEKWQDEIISRYSYNI